LLSPVAKTVTVAADEAPLAGMATSAVAIRAEIPPTAAAISFRRCFMAHLPRRLLFYRPSIFFPGLFLSLRISVMGRPRPMEQIALGEIVM
jgi:hypothetical protein